jgi:hypothetical protein
MRKLTDKQQKFLDVLFEEAQGNYAKAKQLAGYSDNVATSSITEALQEEILEKTKKFLVSSGVKAAWAMVNIMDNPTDLGNKEKMVAAKDLLDRAGHKAGEKIEVKADSPIFILPEKKE